MKRYQRYLGVAAVMAVCIALLSFTNAGSAVAQGVLNPVMALIVNDASNPVPVQDVGEPVRTPFSYDVVGDCVDLGCGMTFPVVPEGKRLVILHVGAVARPTSTSTIVDFAELTTSNPTDPTFGVRNTFPMTRIGQAGDAVTADTWAMNQPVLAYVEPGASAHIITRNRDSGDVFFAQATISGYLVDLE